MADTPDVLRWTTMTPAVNEIKSPNNFVFNLLFAGNEQLMGTRAFEISYLRRGRQIAPFVKRNGAAIMISGHNEDFATVQPPHIRIKRPMEPTDLFNTRRAGTTIFIDESEQERAIDEYMARELQNLTDDADESVEWLAANILRGTVSYVSEDEASFEIVTPRSATHDYALASGSFWDETPNIRKDFFDVARLINTDVGGNPTDVLMGEEAAEHFMDDSTIASKLDNRNIDAGTLQLMEQFNEAGAIFLGRLFNGVRCWEYSRKVSVNGTEESLIRPKYAEFVTNTRAAQNTTYYGVIEDMKALSENGGSIRSRRFAKSWEEEDPSVRVALLETNPLPLPRRPDSTVSVKVVSG